VGARRAAGAGRGHGRRDDRGGEPAGGRGEARASGSGAASGAAAPRPYRVARWGKFWSLEPLFADSRAYLVAKGGVTPRLDDLVLAVPVHGDRRSITQVLGRADELPAVLRALMWANDVRQGFETAVLDETAAVAARAERDDPGRRDLTGLPTFTIDPDAARDFDDAISVAREGSGYRAHVHIADVSYFVDAGGAIDGEARLRTSSVYLPLFAEPMLPAALSSGLCSLVPRRPRKCVTAELTFDAEGRRTSVQFYRSLISSDHRLTYGFADRVLGEAGTAATEDAGGAAADAASRGPASQPAARVDPSPPGPPIGELAALEPSAPAGVPDATMQADEALVAQLLLSFELARLLRARRFARGALALGSFEPEYEFGTGGALVGAISRPETASHQLVEEFMLAANEAIAEFLLRRRAATLYRVHEPPDPASAARLWEAMDELGVRVPPLPSAERLETGVLAAGYARLLEAVQEIQRREKRGRLAFTQRVLRSLKQARYAPRNLGHFGLASPAYLHFTSPIRRYPDLVAHRALLRELGEGGAPAPGDELVGVGERCSEMERTISRLEFDADEVALAFLLERRLRERGWEEVYSGEIVGLLGGGLFVHFGGTFEGFLPVRRLGRERFALTEHETTLVGDVSGRRLRLGDSIDVRVERLDSLSGKVELTPALGDATGPETAPGRRPARRTTGSRPPRRRAPGSEQRRRGR
jgi:ribonuclease R